MKLKIKDFSELTGVSVRTLHYYDETGLLKPSSVDEQNGYRFYDEENLSKMQEILFYRELDFPLKEISEILSSPDYDKKSAIKKQIHLLTLKKERLERMISALDKNLKGEDLSMNIFDNSEFEKQREMYKKEAKEKWGNTDAYRESLEKTKDYSDEKWNSITSGMDDIFAEFSECMKNSPDKAKGLVKKLQDYITENFYNCTDEILKGLAEMYVLDERFKNSIDRHGDGTAEFVRDSIRKYVK